MPQQKGVLFRGTIFQNESGLKVDVRNERSLLKNGPCYFEGVVGTGVEKKSKANPCLLTTTQPPIVRYILHMISQ